MFPSGDVPPDFDHSSSHRKKIKHLDDYQQSVPEGQHRGTKRNGYENKVATQSNVTERKFMGHELRRERLSLVSCHQKGLPNFVQFTGKEELV